MYKRANFNGFDTKIVRKILRIVLCFSEEGVMKKVMLLTPVFLAACSTGAVISTGSDTYSVTSSGAGFSTDGVKVAVYKTANEYCTKQGREMVEVSLKTQDGALGRNPPSADLKFRCLVQGNPEIQRRVSGVQAVAITSSVEGGGASVDKYAQIKQLKELLDSGAITQNEFDKQKSKLLAQ